MGRSIYVAAGGGGDALAALIFAHAVTGVDSAPIVVSYSWDRYLIDPTPGPRIPADFNGLSQISQHCWEIGAEASLRAEGISGLTLLAQRTNARFVLMDPSDGAVGIRKQLSELVNEFDVDKVVLVDVGGDVAARGDEPTLLSPLGDSLALAAVAGAGLPATVAVLGPGLDGELSARQVHDELVLAGAEQLTLTQTDVDPYMACLEVHPSEATMLVAAAAKGIEGRAEIRDKGALITLDGSSANAYIVDSAAVFQINKVAQSLADTHSFREAEILTKRMCGRTELDHERRKAAALAANRPIEPPVTELGVRLKAYCADAAARGVDLVTFRKLTEAIGKQRYEPSTIRQLAGGLPFDCLPLCRTSTTRY